MGVAVDQARRDRPAAGIDAPGPGSDQGLDFGGAADRGDPLAGNRDRFGDAVLRVDRDHLAAGDHEVGRRRHQAPTA